MKCPFCGESIQDEATICRFCNRNVTLHGRLRRRAIIVVLVVVGIAIAYGFFSRTGDSPRVSTSSFVEPSSLRRSDDDAVLIVKSGTLEFDQSTTIGHAIDHYRYFDHVDWKYFITENQRRVVQAVGTMPLSQINEDELSSIVSAYRDQLKKFSSDWSFYTHTGSISLDDGVLAFVAPQNSEPRKIKAVEIVIEFLMNQDGGFGVHSGAFRLVPADGTTRSEYFAQPASDNLAMLQAIYENQLPLRVGSAISLVKFSETHLGRQ